MIQNNPNQDEIEVLKSLNYEFKELLSTKNWNKIKERIKDIQDANDVNKMKMVLIVIQSYQNYDEISEERNSLYQQFNEAVNLLNSKNKI